MGKLKFILYINSFDAYGELALVNKETNEIILKGDDYHNKINICIENFLKGLSYANVEYSCEKVILNEKDCNELPFLLDFYYESEKNIVHNIEDNTISIEQESVDFIEYVEETKKENLDLSDANLLDFCIWTTQDEYEINTYIENALLDTYNRQGTLYVGTKQNTKCIYSSSEDIEVNNQLLKGHNIGIREHEKGEEFYYLDSGKTICRKE